MRKCLPGHIEGMLRYISVEKRFGTPDRCRELYMEAIGAATTEEYQKVFLYIHYAKTGTSRIRVGF
jgi:hypothetical protein